MTGRTDQKVGASRHRAGELARVASNNGRDWRKLRQSLPSVIASP